MMMRSLYGSGVFSREGLLKIIDENIDLRIIGNSEYELFAAAYNMNKFDVDYLSLNGRNEKDIKNILLATSALPIIFNSEEVDGNRYMDGGIKDNVPIKPLYDRGYRTFIVVHLSRDSMIYKEKFEDANIIEIVPSENQGNLIKGTLDFSKDGADRRIIQGYNDAVKILKPLYEMGMVQAKIGCVLNNMKNDEINFRKEKTKIREERDSLKSELEDLLNNY